MGGAAAQGLNNAPYDFGGKGLGISPAGKQVILNEKLFGIRPDNITVGPDGSLLTTVRGPGDSAIVFDSSGTAVPGYMGRSWTGDAYNMRLFNRMSYLDRSEGQASTIAAMSGWTNMVGGSDDEFAFANYLLPSGLNTLDFLVWQVQTL